MTDVHFGAKGNSEQHNNDCINYLKWFSKQVQQDKAIDYIAFLGDWHENRSALNVSTLDYSYRGAKILNDLGLPVYFIVGNHDLYFRHTRDVVSVVAFNEFSNFRMIDQITLVDDIEGSVLFSPYLFHHEYQKLLQYRNIPTWIGHFEFKSFVITGYNVVMPTGPDPKEFGGPDYIFSGHFHKRQAGENIIYIGNTFPTSFADQNDFDRGMAIYDHIKKKVTFKNWNDCPKYISTSLSKIENKLIDLPPQARVKCVVDSPLSYEQVIQTKQLMISKYQLRELIMEEPDDFADAIKNTDTSVVITNNSDGKLTNIDDFVIQMLSEIESEKIDNELLVEIYKQIRIDHD